VPQLLKNVRFAPGRAARQRERAAAIAAAEAAAERPRAAPDPQVGHRAADPRHGRMRGRGASGQFFALSTILPAVIQGIMARSFSPTCLDLVLVVERRVALNIGWPTAFLHPVAHEAAGLDVGQHRLHPRLGLVIGQDARAGDVFAVFGGVRDRIVHVGDAALIDQVDDQLHLVQAFEIGHLGLVAGLDQRLEAHADQFHQAAAEHRLLAEEVGLAFLPEVGLDDARPPAADGRAIGQADLQRLARGVVVHRHKAGHAAALDVFAAHGVAGALGRHHDDIDAGLRLDQAEMHVQAVGEGDRRAVAQVVMDIFACRSRPAIRRAW
jgi:hypothetical protein